MFYYLGITKLIVQYCYRIIITKAYYNTTKGLHFYPMSRKTPSFHILLAMKWLSRMGKTLAISGRRYQRLPAVAGMLFN